VGLLRSRRAAPRNSDPCPGQPVASDGSRALDPMADPEQPQEELLPVDV